MRDPLGMHLQVPVLQTPFADCIRHASMVAINLNETQQVTLGV